MGLDLWFREDVARILASTQAAMAAAMQASLQAAIEAPGQTSRSTTDPSWSAWAQAESYRQGFSDALYAVAVAFGVAAPTGHSLPRPTISEGRKDDGVW